MLPIPTELLVLLLLNTENNNHPDVHFQKLIINLTLLLPLMKSVPNNVSHVTQIQMSVEDVVLLPLTEKITRKPVLVKMVISKMLTTSANHVTRRDV